MACERTGRPLAASHCCSMAHTVDGTLYIVRSQLLRFVHIHTAPRADIRHRSDMHTGTRKRCTTSRQHRAPDLHKFNCMEVYGSCTVARQPHHYHAHGASRGAEACTGYGCKSCRCTGSDYASAESSSSRGRGWYADDSCYSSADAAAAAGECQGVRITASLFGGLPPFCF